MVSGVVGRPSTAAAPAGRLRIARCTGQHRRPQLGDAVTPTLNETYERGRTGAPTGVLPPNDGGGPSARAAFLRAIPPASGRAPRVMSLASRRVRQTWRARASLPLHMRQVSLPPVATRKRVCLAAGRLAVPSQSRGVSANAVPPI